MFKRLKKEKLELSIYEKNDKDYLYGLAVVDPELIPIEFPRLNTYMVSYYVLENNTIIHTIEERKSFINRILNDKKFFNSLIGF